VDRAQPPLTLGTAGHIDHGKTALVRALTGTDTDRLPEEKARGVSIALGYARLGLPSGRSLSVVDVPGHERFVRTMVAGATGIDLFLLVVAADDAVMPQTREHVAVLRALGISAGVVAVTKADAADPARAAAEVAALVPGACRVAVSARTGAGLGELLAALDDVAAALPGRAVESATNPAVLHVDRVFTITGAGTVVTGTLWAGAIARGDTLEVLPSGRRARARGVQVHDEDVASAVAGQRVAVNLAGVAQDEVARGDVLAAPGAGVAATRAFDARLAFPGEPPADGERVQVHHGTRQTPGRLRRPSRSPGDVWRLRLEQPLVTRPGDRLVIRRIAPPDTLGGGVVAEPPPVPPGRPVHAVAAAPSPPPLTPVALALEERLRAAGDRPPGDAELTAEERDALAALRAAGRAVRVGRALHFHPEALARIRARVVALLDAEGSLSLAGLRDELGSSRRFAQALLEHFDAERLTRRAGEVHVLRRRREAERDANL
jgi:selenocysteine-specific elongation factor